MHKLDAETTSATLLNRLRLHPEDPAAWHAFVERYRPRIYAFCVALPLQPSDAEDVTQTVLLKLVAKLREFHYDPSQSFRGWLQTVTRHALSDFLAERTRAPATGDSVIARLLATVEAREGLVQQLGAEFDLELLEAALARVRPHVSPQQWEAFRLTALEGMTGAAVAARLGMVVISVYAARSKVQKLVRAEIRLLNRDPSAPPEPPLHPGNTGP